MDIKDLIQPSSVTPYALNVRGTNGCGKTSLVRNLIESDSGAEEIFVNGLKKPAFVYTPKHNVLVVGSYRNKCGGCDTLVKEQIVKLVTLAWITTANIVFEGVLVSDSKLPYWHLMRDLSANIQRRTYGFVYLELPVETCLSRIYARNGGKEIKENLVVDKWNNARKYREFHQQQEDLQVFVLDAGLPKQEVYDNFLSVVSHIQTVKPVYLR